MRDSTTVEYLQAVFVMRRGRWRPVPDAQLGTNARLFGEAWAYGAVPGPGVGERYVALGEADSLAAALQRLQQQPKQELGALVLRGTGRTCVGGWLSW